jgi:hypothetical protein
MKNIFNIHPMLLHFFFRYINQRWTIGFKIKYTPRVAVRLLNIFNCLAYDWTVKDDWKVTFFLSWRYTNIYQHQVWGHPKRDVARCLYIANEKKNRWKKIQQTYNLHKISRNVPLDFLKKVVTFRNDLKFKMLTLALIDWVITDFYLRTTC